MVRQCRSKIGQSLGAKKLYRELKEDFKKQGVKMGRDKFYTFLKTLRLLVPRTKNYPITTNSNHHFYKYKNLITNKITTRAKQLWATDITYIKTQNGHAYLALVTDAYSKKIMGYQLDDNMRTSLCIDTLKMTLSLIGLVLVFTQLVAQENYGNTLNTFVKFGSNSSITANYEFQVASDITLAPTARIWFSGNNTFALGGRGDFYFDRLFGLSEPWDIWAGADAGFVVSGDSKKDDFNLNLHAGVEYKFSTMFGVIFEFGGGSTSSGGIGLAFHF